MKTVKIGVMGATRGTELMKAFQDHEEAQIVAICDKFLPLLEKTKEFCKSLGKEIQCFDNFDDFLSADMDAVVIANYANEHTPFVVKALEAGKHVLSEVMPTQTLAEAVQIVEAVEKSGKKYIYGEQYCYFDAMFEMRLRYDRGEIGEAQGMQSIFVNNLQYRWPRLTRGERNNWRNWVPATFYCSHSIGPMFFTTGLRPVNVVGLEIPASETFRQLGAFCEGCGMEVMTLNNGAIATSIHGNLVRPYLAGCNIYGSKGSMETDRYQYGLLHIFKEQDISGWNSTYDLNNIHVNTEAESHRFVEEHVEVHPNLGKTGGKVLEHLHGTELLLESFIGAITDNPETGKYAIDIYQALDMSLPGLLAHRSYLNDSETIVVPDFRDKAVRDLYRNDYTCTDPKIASGDQLLPASKGGNPEIAEEVFDRVKAMFLNGIAK